MGNQRYIKGGAEKARLQPYSIGSWFNQHQAPEESANVSTAPETADAELLLDDNQEPLPSTNAWKEQKGENSHLRMADPAAA